MESCVSGFVLFFLLSCYLSFECLGLLFEPGKLCAIFRCSDKDVRRVVGVVAIHGVHGGVAEKGGELVEVLLGKGVEFVIVALGAACGESLEDTHGGADAVGGIHHADFFRNGTALTGGGQAAVEAGGDFLIEGGVWEHVAGHLFEGELIEGHVAVEGLDDPIAVGPDGAVVVIMDAVGVAIPGDVEPVPPHLLAVGWVFEKLVEQGVDGGGLVFLEGGSKLRDLCGSGREANDIEVDAADEAVGFLNGVGFEIGFFDVGEDKMIDGIGDPFLIGNLGRGGAGGFGEGPVIFVFGSLFDPFFKKGDLIVAEGFVALFGRHFLGVDDFHKEGFFRVALDDDRFAVFEGGKGFFLDIEAEGVFLGFTGAGIGPVAVVAIIREDGLDVGVEGDFLREGVGGQRESGGEKKGAKLHGR